MAKFYGKVGFGISSETAPGVWEDGIVERSYLGDVLNAARRLEPGEGLNQNLSLSNRISIVMDEYFENNVYALRYISYAGGLWVVNTVEIKPPRVILSLGEVYNGPR